MSILDYSPEVPQETILKSPAYNIKDLSLPGDQKADYSAGDNQLF